MAAVTTSEYMSANQIPLLIEALRSSLEKEKPLDPLEFISDVVKNVPRHKMIIKGAPASGKGTQCDKLVKQLGVVHISTGDILRDEIAKKSELGMKAKEFMAAGKLVPDHLVIDLVKNRLQEDDVKKQGWLLDGFPRTGAQAKIMIEEGIIPECVMRLDVPDSEIIRRVEGRRIDPVTKKVYHITNKPPPPGVKVIQRPDDTIEAIKTRLQTYHSNLDSMLACYTCPVILIRGANEHEVHRKILSAYQKLRWSKIHQGSGSKM
eukprot:TRINITY_DN2504_c5_g1_i1.p1 TRINITY_DN2504_c5_g1~~TRINITY_DN2504_c5_g1_i1.p1  ORF type:complete len:263 (+),score=41.51 TRINITY_DN2504_c5_g1_i1:73-861(+)